MPDLPTRLDYFALGRQYVLQRAKKIDPGMVDVAGSNINLFVGAGSILADAVTKQLGYRASALTLDGAFDEDLDRYAWDRYQQTRKGASPATGQERLYRGSFAGGAGTVPAGTVLVTNSGVEYVTTQPGIFGPTTLDNVVVNIRAVQAGKTTQVGANNLRRFKNPAALFDGTLQCNNDSTTAGGEEREDDDTLKNRLREFWNTAQRGTLVAIQNGALSVPGVVSASAQEVIDPSSRPARLVQLYIADSSGVASVPLANAVAQAENDFRAGGIAVIINLSLPFMQAVALKLTFQTGVDSVTLSAQVQAAVVEFVNNLPVNGTLYIAQLYSVLQRFAADGLVMNATSIQSPAGDVVPTIGQSIRTQTQLVTLS